MKRDCCNKQQNHQNNKIYHINPKPVIGILFHKLVIVQINAILIVHEKTAIRAADKRPTNCLKNIFRLQRAMVSHSINHQVASHIHLAHLLFFLRFLILFKTTFSLHTGSKLQTAQSSFKARCTYIFFFNTLF